ncbi:hypothetical protein HYPSUDRAFT_677881 [Hypholoma sublateritium FD-334 SS-4]|uniref:Uncharacterized protein n=1 Tax=Hypholoma sublateritium (strain FD-334 SS-4) TaxID=945553 RepID=A0A0D2PPE9_HYPSF|nr:hypothetical protein HYPSUDRAFT_677881 [Hypholoma sublateritium FD-334 SS-4]
MYEPICLCQICLTTRSRASSDPRTARWARYCIGPLHPLSISTPFRCSRRHRSLTASLSADYLFIIKFETNRHTAVNTAQCLHLSARPQVIVSSVWVHVWNDPQRASLGRALRKT